MNEFYRKVRTVRNNRFFCVPWGLFFHCEGFGGFLEGVLDSVGEGFSCGKCFEIILFRLTEIIVPPLVIG